MKFEFTAPRFQFAALPVLGKASLGRAGTGTWPRRPPGTPQLGLGDEEGPKGRAGALGPCTAPAMDPPQGGLGSGMELRGHLVHQD